ncbi:MAG: ribonuclease HII [Pseudomonadales bacterium]|nr:ribonuclease HII [Pseudomonadales bacterium]
MYRQDYFAGVDEVGRGPLAGAVFAAAVVLDPFSQIDGLRDSKMLSAKRREVLNEEIKSRAVAWSIGRADVEEIDRINILQATMQAMRRAVSGLWAPVGFVVVDGNRTPGFDNCQSDWLIQGDGKLDAIRAASIIAKVARDREMEDLDEMYPDYGLARHKGYATRYHLDALRKHGPSPVHRMSFAPCRQRELFT